MELKQFDFICFFLDAASVNKVFMHSLFISLVAINLRAARWIISFSHASFWAVFVGLIEIRSQVARLIEQNSTKKKIVLWALRSRRVMTNELFPYLFFLILSKSSVRSSELETWIAFCSTHPKRYFVNPQMNFGILVSKSKYF